MAEGMTARAGAAGRPERKQARPRHLADFAADPRVLVLSGMAILVGTGGAVAAWLLVKLIALATDLVWFGRLST